MYIYIIHQSFAALRIGSTMNLEEAIVKFTKPNIHQHSPYEFVSAAVDVKSLIHSKKTPRGLQDASSRQMKVFFWFP